MASEKEKTPDAKPPEPPKTEPTKPAPPQPMKLDVDYQGSNGKYNLIITVGSSQGGGIAADILIIIGEQTPVEQRTKSNGLLVYPVPQFTEKELDVEVQVAGYPELQDTLTLDGPPKNSPQKERVGFWKGIVLGGFRENFKKVKEEETGETEE